MPERRASKVWTPGRLVVVLAFVSFIPPVFAQGGGHPDLAGIWNSATATPLERPARLKGKEFFTPAEAAEWERQASAQNEDPASDRAASNVGTYNTAFREFRR
jgi:hypothetical protein